ncbi:MAG TPA: OmpA family protein [Nitrospira sp.]|nr:OmpA family protein [Nitrospira sp.]
MQKAPTATVNAGPVSPTVVGPHNDRKDTYILSGLIGFLAIVVAAFWYYSQTDEAAHSNRSTEALNGVQVSQVLTHPTDNPSISAPMPMTPVEGIPLAARSTDVLHDDIHFEVGRKGLTDDGKAALQRHAEFLKGEPDWGILLTGHTDQQGSMSFNKILGLKRAETVKQQLIALGVPASSIRAVSLGEEGALCLDNSDICRLLNRRVHLELRRIGQEHMVVPTAAGETVTDPFSNNLDLSAESMPTESSKESRSFSIPNTSEATTE